MQTLVTLGVFSASVVWFFMPTLGTSSAWSVLAVPENRGQGAGLPKDSDVKTVGNDESKRWRGGTGGPARIEERVNATYAYILEGGTSRQIAERTASRFNVSIRTAHDDYSPRNGVT